MLQRKCDTIEHVPLGKSGQSLRVHRKGAGWVAASQQVLFKLVVDPLLEVDRGNGHLLQPMHTCGGHLADNRQSWPQGANHIVRVVGAYKEPGEPQAPMIS
jgi:hypothetical protein